MTDIETRARDALNDVSVERFGGAFPADTYTTRRESISFETVCRTIEAHDATKATLAERDAEFEAYKRKVSDHLGYIADKYDLHTELADFILPPPVDPLVLEGRRQFEIFWPGEGALEGKRDGSVWMQRLIAALRRGMELATITEQNP